MPKTANPRATSRAANTVFDPLAPWAGAGFTQQGLGPVGEYMTDAVQRTVLFWDVLRQRSDQYYAQRAKEVPNVLSFDAELVLDARTFAKPVNYLLVRVKPPQGVVIDPQKRPFVVIDPRAGHGPGFGGFKADSEIGVAMKAGHPCYFVGFTPEPTPGQTIEDIIYAEVAFLEKVIALHPEADGKPCAIGNCQAGWAIMMVAAIRPDLFGPIIIPGSPLSYWAGIEGQNPMRYSGGMAGGSWTTALASDLGNGKFDGGYLVENFEKQNPANTLWSKNYNLWSKVDTEGKRFIEFEKWWGGHVILNGEEIQWIVDQLFVGNRLATAEIVTSVGDRIDLRNIRSPIICFCSKGDNITPPQQALGWIVDLYAKDDDVRACGQTIIYAVHESVGHLGIFVSGGVAKKEHQEFASNIDLIDVLPPGLYEAVMTPKTAESTNADLVSGDWIVRFEPRTLDDVRAIVEPDPEMERRFAAVRRVSEINLGLYRTLLQPLVKASINEQSAEWLHKLNHAELPYQLFSDANPLMQPLAQMAEQVREKRQAASPDNPMLQWQAMVSDQIVAGLNGWRDFQEVSVEKLFLAIYGSPLIQAMVGVDSADQAPRRGPGMEPERMAFVEKRIAELKAGIAVGGVREAALRTLLYVGLAGQGTDERAFNELREIRAEHKGLPLAGFKQAVREQYFGLMLDRDAALAAIPKMLPADAVSRRQTLQIVRRVLEAAGPLTGERAERFAQVEKVFATGAETAPAKKSAARKPPANNTAVSKAAAKKTAAGKAPAKSAARKPRPTPTMTRKRK